MGLLIFDIRLFGLGLSLIIGLLDYLGYWVCIAD